MLALIIAQITKDEELCQSKAKGGSVHEENACDEVFSAFYSARLFKEVSQTGPWVDQAQDKIGKSFGNYFSMQ